MPNRRVAYLAGAMRYSGGVECQKSGSLHFHFLAFLGRIHQHQTLHEIAEKLRAGLLSVEALKAYHCWVSRETYPDPVQQAAEKDELEAQWPAYRGDRRLGRIPHFLSVSYTHLTLPTNREV